MTSEIGAFVSADWSKSPNKRSVHVAVPCERSIQRVEDAWTVKALLRLARGFEGRTGPVLVGIDAVLGVPAGYWRMAPWGESGEPPRHFLDWLGGIDPDSDFFHEVEAPEDWCPCRPFFAVPKGEGGKTSFTEKVDGGMLRRIDEATSANPLFAVSGIPGTVGSATRSLWNELIPLLNSEDRDFAVWPFEGALPALLSERRVVLAETYPRLAYAAAFSERLPTSPVKIAKSKRPERERFCDCLETAAWVREHGVDLGDLDPARRNEDAFDSFLTAAAALRCILEGWALCDPEWIDGEAEGSMLLAGPVDPAGKVRSAASMR